MKMDMRRIFLLGIAFVLVFTGMFFTACNGKKVETKSVRGVLEEPVKEGAAPETVNATLDRHVLDSNFENILNDTANKVAVWSLVRCDSVTSSEGFGIVVAKGGMATILSNFRHGNAPQAKYDAANDCLWLTGVSMEGTGVHVERLCQVKFREDGPAYIAATIDPYEMQQKLSDELKYSVKKDKITLYCGDKEPVTVTNTVKDMGDFYDDAVWLGEQIHYNINGGGENLFVLATPGVNFVTGKVLHYDDMPTVSAKVTLNADGSFSLSNLSIIGTGSF